MLQTGLLQFSDIDTTAKLELYIQQQVQQDEGDPARGLTFLVDDGAKLSSIIRDTTFSTFDVDVGQQDEFTELHLSKYKDKEEKQTLDGTIYILSHKEDKVYTAFSLCDDGFFEKCVKSYIKSLPAISTSYLTTDELRGVFDVLDDQTNGDIYVSDAVIKSPRDKTDILYLKERYFNLFNTEKVADGDYFVDKVNFTISGRSSFTGHLSRSGESRYNSGSSDIYFDYLLDISGEAIIEKGSIFENKERKYGSREANRLEIEYEPGTIQGREANLELIDALRGMNASSLTVYHKNPYLHASVLDFHDGTSADIFITSDRTISIIPGFEASMGSLSRICDRINSHFNEGAVHVGKSDDPRFDEFFSG